MHFTKHITLLAVLLLALVHNATAQKVMMQSQLEHQRLARPDISIHFPNEKLAAPSRVEELFVSDFSDGDEWTVDVVTPSDTAIWQITTQDTILGDFTQTVFSDASTANGYALFNYDGAVNGNTSLDSFPQYLVSPVYDISSLDSGNTYELAFRQDFRYCCTPRTPGTSVSVSYDGGASYAPAQTVNRYAFVNDEVSDVTGVRLPPGADTATQFRVRFYYDGTFYFWALDDVRIRVLPEVDADLSDDFFAVTPNAAVPVTQVDGDIDLLVDVRNRGNRDLTFNVVASVYELVNGSALGELISQDSLLYESIVYDSLAENEVFPVSFPYPTEVGQYVLEYRVQFTDADVVDEDPSNNLVQHVFAVTENLYAKTLRTLSGRRSVDVTDGSAAFEVGNVYYFPRTARAENTVIDSVVTQVFNFGFTPAQLSEVELEVVVYGADGDSNGNGVADGTELTFLEATSLRIPADYLGEAGNFRDLVARFDPPVQLSDDYPAYAVTVTYNPPAGTTLDQAFFIGTGPEYSAQQFAATEDDPTYVNHIYRESLDGEEPFIYIGIDGQAPVVQTYVTADLSSTRDQLGTAEVNVTPNPADDQLTVNLDLASPSATARIELVNAVGQTVAVVTRHGVQATQIRVPTRHLPAGLYHLTVQLDGNREASRSVIIQH